MSSSAVTSNDAAVTQYTARAGGTGASDEIRMRIRDGLGLPASEEASGGSESRTLFHPLSLKRDFSTQWHRMVVDYNAAPGGDDAVQVRASLQLTRALLPYPMLAFDAIETEQFVVVVIPKAGRSTKPKSGWQRAS